MSEDEDVVSGPRAPRLNWDLICLQAADIVRSYDTGVTLRQLFYRLVSAQVIPNSQSAYSRLSRTTSIARREGWFPDLIDNTRGIQVPASWSSPTNAVSALKSQYRRDRTEGQEYTIYVAVEKNALRTQLEHWFDERGIPVLAFGGYPSQTFVNEIKEDIDARGRPAICIYGGDFDPTGIDILRDFKERTAGYWDEVWRVALNYEQIDEYRLPPLPGKDWDPRAAGFAAAYGRVMQVELDALDPNDLRKIYMEAVDRYWDEDAFVAICDLEDNENAQILRPHDVMVAVRGIQNAQDIMDEVTRLRGKPSRRVLDDWARRMRLANRFIDEHEEAFNPDAD